MVGRATKSMIVVIAAIGVTAVIPQQASARTCAQAKQLAAYYTSRIPQMCQNYAYNPSLKRRCEQNLRNTIDQILKNACSGQVNPPKRPPKKPKCTKDFCGIARNRGRAVMQWYRRIRNQNAYNYHISFSYRPTYQGQCHWTPSRNGYSNVSAYRFQRIVSSLSNRCNLITRVRVTRRRR